MVGTMKRNVKNVCVMAVLCLLTLGGWFLRSTQPVDGAAVLAWASAVLVAVFGLFSLTLTQKKTAASVSGSNWALSLLSLGAVAMALGCALLRWRAGESAALAVLLAATALCWAVTALLRQLGKPVSPWLLMLPAVFFGAELVNKFRHWGSDPLILDYCYELLALIAAMCGTFHMSGFAFDRGRSRSAVFFCMGGVFFNGVALADASGSEALLRVACVAWLLVCLCLLLRKDRKEV